MFHIGHWRNWRCKLMSCNIIKITLEQMTELMDAHINTKFFPNVVLSVAANHITHSFDVSILRDLFKRHNIWANVKNDQRLQAFSLSSTCKVAAGSRTTIVCYGTDPDVLLAHMVHHVSLAKKVASRVGMNSVLFFWPPLSQDEFLMNQLKARLGPSEELHPYMQGAAYFVETPVTTPSVWKGFHGIESVSIFCQSQTLYWTYLGNGGSDWCKRKGSVLFGYWVNNMAMTYCLAHDLDVGQSLK